MSPILGIWASAQQPAQFATSFDSIATTTVGSGGSSTITFSSIASTYKHLQLRILAKPASGQPWLSVRLNSATTGYSFHALYGTGAAAGAEGGASVSLARMGINDPAQFGVYVIDLLDYTNTNKYKTLRCLWGFDANGSGYTGINSSVWQNTNAVDTITIINEGGTNFAQYSHFALYGVKG